MKSLSETQENFLKWVYATKLISKHRQGGMTHRVLQDRGYKIGDSASLNYWGKVFGPDYLEFLKSEKK